MVGQRRPAAISRPLVKMLRPGIEMVRSHVHGLDPVTRRVATDAGELAGDAVVIALGAELAPEAIPGYPDAAHDFFTLEGAGRFASALAGFSGGRVVVAISGLPFKCPAAPYEAAFLIDADLRRRGLRDRSTIELHTPEPAPMPVAGPVLGRAVVDLLTERGIGYFPGHPVEAYDGASRQVRFTDGSVADFDLLAAVPPHRPPAAVAGSGLTNPTGWVPVDRDTLETSAPNVFAIGDVTAITLANGKLLPKAGVFAHAEAQVAAAQIASRIEGGPSDQFNGQGTAGWSSAAVSPASPPGTSTRLRIRRSRFAARVESGTPARSCSSATGSAGVSSTSWPAPACAWAARSCAFPGGYEVS